jgi:NADH-quinone oxidoreductase subunit B
MAEPKWVCCRERLQVVYLITYSVLQGIDKVIPVMHVPGCPRPEQIVDGVMKLQELVKNRSVRRRSSPEYQELSYNIK